MIIYRNVSQTLLGTWVTWGAFKNIDSPRQGPAFIFLKNVPCCLMRPEGHTGSQLWVLPPFLAPSCAVTLSYTHCTLLDGLCLWKPRVFLFLYPLPGSFQILIFMWLFLLIFQAKLQCPFLRDTLVKQPFSYSHAALFSFFFTSVSVIILCSFYPAVLHKGEHFSDIVALSLAPRAVSGI